MKKAGPNMFAILIFCIIFVPSAVLAYMKYMSSGDPNTNWIWIIALVIALAISSAIKVADQWERVVVLRLGKFLSLKGPGLFFIIPVIDSIPYWIDLRVITTSFSAEKTLTEDTVPVDVDAVLFWKVIVPEKAALEVADYREAITWACQTALRDVIGKSKLSDMLVGREKIDTELQNIIYERIEPWGVNVIAVEIRDVVIPSGLEDAMSMQAQAERERQARIILGDAERQVAEKFEEAAKTYTDNPTALHLRAMNILYEGIKERSTLVIVPSTAVETMQLGSIAGIAALSKEFAPESKIEAKDDKDTKSQGEIKEKDQDTTPMNSD
ncbi:MAG: slipin family protein [Thermodesulfobacteriota bacterium]|nr:slipin family protein [Thermodesulfobacteriota bacterium]